MRQRTEQAAAWRLLVFSATVAVVMMAGSYLAWEYWGGERGLGLLKAAGWDLAWSAACLAALYAGSFWLSRVYLATEPARSVRWLWLLLHGGERFLARRWRALLAASLVFLIAFAVVLSRTAGDQLPTLVLMASTILLAVMAALGNALSRTGGFLQMLARDCGLPAGEDEGDLGTGADPQP